MTQQEALQLRDRFYRCETTTEEERALVALLLSDDCPEELLADRHAIITLAREEAVIGASPQQPTDSPPCPSLQGRGVDGLSSPTLKASACRNILLPSLIGRGRGESLHGGEPGGLRRIAAAVAVIVLAGGLALAAIQLASSPKPSTPSCQVGGDTIAASQAVARTTPPVRFENARLDSVLAVVAAHYGCAVSFVDELPRRLRLSTTWQPARPLSEFVSLMNELNGLHLMVNGDTIIVSEKTLPHPLPTREGRK